MSYDWEDAAKSKGGGSNAPKIPPGAGIDLKIIRVVFGKKGERFETKNGDPQIMLIFADSVEREAAVMVTLSEKAGFKLAQILSAAGANVKRMTEAGVTPDKFADEQFANANLVGRKLKGDISYDDTGKWADITPLRPDTTAPTSQAPAEEKKKDPIPF